MDKIMHLSEESTMPGDFANQESTRELFVRRVTSSGLVLKFKQVDKYGTVPSEYTIPTQEGSPSGGRNAMNPMHSFEANCSHNVMPLMGKSIENGSTYGSGVHTCGRCGKHFKDISSLNGHMGSHRREDYKRIRMMLEQSIPLEQHVAKKRELRHVWGASQAIVEMSAYVWHPKYGTSSIDLSASTTSPDKHSTEESYEMREAAEVLATLAKRVCNSTVKGFMCKTCNKVFSSYRALGGHMSIHSKPKDSLLVEDGAGSKRSTWKYVCHKCNERFPTGQSLGGHKRRHWFEECKMKPPPANAIVKPPLSLPHETEQSSGPVVLPIDEKMEPPMLLASGTKQPRGLELAYDAIQQPQQIKRLGNETTCADLPETTGTPSAERCVFDLNTLPRESNE